jgi:rhamnose utilization protein RhaD (predicted bifunctional aldolase and dehydrogenase)/NAD(P)-dependent dehydrogenase (short-subunit alcohol dehydrogenase family)
MKNRWNEGLPKRGDDLDLLVHLSNRIGLEESLVQPGGGNTSVKVVRENAAGERAEVLLVKGSGTDLKTISRRGFTALPMPRLAGLTERGDMSDAQMMAFMRDCMQNADDPLPSVETPLHSILPHRVIAHTHDVATMSLTNLKDELAEKLVGEIFEGEIFYVPYARPGFPLAQTVLDLVAQIPERAGGLTLAHHGLVVWGEDAKTCYERMLRVVGKVEEYVAAKKRGRRSRPTRRSAAAGPEVRRDRAEVLLPVIRGALSATDRVVLHFDDSPEILERLADARAEELSQRGMATPEHILRAGRLPVFLNLDFSNVDLDRDEDTLVEAARAQLRAAREAYDAYHARHRDASDVEPLADWAKVVLVPGLGMVTAFKDKRSAITANTCYRAVMESIENAEAIDEFRFLNEDDVYEFEHWPLERRKVDETIAKERKELLLPRHVVVVVGAGSGIGEAAARRFVEEGANVVVADLDAKRADEVANALVEKFPGRAIGVGVDVCDERRLDALFRRTVLEFGGLDCLFYSAGLAPRFAEIAEIRSEDLRQQLEVHYIGAVLAMSCAARVMKRQGIGGSILCSVSKAAVSPGKEAVAYGGSVEERAKSRGNTFEQQIEAYRERNAMRVSLIPAEAVAEIAALLASDRFRYTSGDILTIDGGLPDAFPR